MILDNLSISINQLLKIIYRIVNIISYGYYFKIYHISSYINITTEKFLFFVMVCHISSVSHKMESFDFRHNTERVVNSHSFQSILEIEIFT